MKFIVSSYTMYGTVHACTIEATGRIAPCSNLSHFVFWVGFFSISSKYYKYEMGLLYCLFQLEFETMDDIVQGVIDTVDTVTQNRIQLSELLESIHDAKTQVGCKTADFEVVRLLEISATCLISRIICMYVWCLECFVCVLHQLLDSSNNGLWIIQL